MRSLFCRTQATLFLLLFLAAPPARTADDGIRDGSFWKQLSPVAKNYYMVGFFDGMDLGNYFSMWGINTKDGKPDLVARTAALRSYEALSQKHMTRVTNGQISDGLDKFYDDYRNRKIRIFDAVWIVLNSIGGMPDGEITALIESLRQNAP